MCTVTYLPLPEEQFLFTSNRDESPLRAASNIQRSFTAGKTLLYPQDSYAKGTWIAIADTRQLVCILNGAFVKHKHQPPYRMSRGLMALQFFDYADADHFFKEFAFKGMEPFTMIIYDQGKLYTLYWDETTPHIKLLDPQQTHIWSSSTLYPPALQTKRAQWFANWEAQQDGYTSASIMDFHRTGGEHDPENDLVMNRQGIVQTTSITHIVAGKETYQMQYNNLLDGNTEEQSLP